jgi:putative membrane protein
MQARSHSEPQWRGNNGCLRRLIIRWVVCAVAMWLSILIVNELVSWLARLQWVTEGRFHIELTSFFGPALFVAALSIVNAVLRPIIVVLACPLNCLTMGLASLFIHALVFYWVGRKVPGIMFPSFLSAFVASIVYSVLSGAIIWVTREPRSR